MLSALQFPEPILNLFQQRMLQHIFGFLVMSLLTEHLAMKGRALPSKRVKITSHSAEIKAKSNRRIQLMTIQFTIT